jgi:histidinol dehydrogenase
MSIVRILDYASIDEATLARLLDRKEWNEPSVLDTCREIIDAVRNEGDEALVELTRRYDGADLSPDRLRVSPEEIERAAACVNDELRRSLTVALANIRRFHETQVRPSVELTEVAGGIWCGERSTPIDSVCLYVPRGRGAFSSVACMLGVPAVLAGVPRVVLCTPPGPDGQIDAATLFVARELGIDHVYRVGGAQAIAAVAFGTERVPRCDKVLGPGNVYVSGARQLLAASIDGGPPAGPSESLIVADGSVDPSNVAWNLLIEAEHGENSCALLVTHERSLAEAVAARAEELTQRLTPQRRQYVETVLGTRGGVLLTADITQSIDFANRFAAEHVALMVREPWVVLPKLKNAGEILLGAYPIMSLANYAMGINAILPTGGGARTYSGISVRDFCKTTSIGYVTSEGFGMLKEVVPPLSRDEGFSAHHEAILDWREG